VPLTFVVGTGRCGSTMLSRILHLHPDILSVSEFFSAVTDNWRNIEVPAHDMNGQEFWDLVSAPAAYSNALFQSGLTVPELFYPYESGRFKTITGMPGICHSTLPMLCDDPDTLFDRLAAIIPGWPKRSAAEQYHSFFALLGELLGRRVIVERSGGSISMIPGLRELFPDARFIHMHRHGPDCALSMSRHVISRVAMLTIEARIRAGLPDSARWEDITAVLPEKFYGLLVPPFDKERFMAYPMALTSFGQLWAGLELAGIAALRELPPADRTNLEYESLIRNHEQELTRLAEFIGVPVTGEWLDAVDKLIDPSKSGSAEARLSAIELATLQAACAPGTRAIAEFTALR
jgi:Sulfotransferase family